MQKIFIDTNIFLDMYRARIDKDISIIMKFIRDNKQYYITTEQSINEFKRNRNNVLNKIIEDITNNTTTENISSNFIRSLKSFEGYNKAAKELKKQKINLTKEIKTLLNNVSKDSLYSKINKLHKQEYIIKTNSNIINLAIQRKFAGNPPTSKKKDTCGDEIIWESLLDYGKNNHNDLIIVTKDSTFHENLTFLQDEYERTTNQKLSVFDNISDGYRAIGVEISEAIMEAETAIKWTDIIVSALANLGGMATLKDIYEEASDIIYFNDCWTKNQNKAKESTIRGILQRFSSDFPNSYSGNKDLFHQVSEGVWSLRE